MVARLAPLRRAELLSVTLTTPDGRELRAIGGTYARQVGEVLLASDRRLNCTEHLHGLCAEGTRGEAVGRWVDLTGARLQAQHARRVDGWDEYARDGEVAALRANVGRVLAYALKPWPQGERDLELDTFVAGALGDAWRAYRGANDVRLVACAICGSVFAPRKRAHARTCSTACRMVAYRARAKLGQDRVCGSGGGR